MPSSNDDSTTTTEEKASSGVQLPAGAVGVGELKRRLQQQGLFGEEPSPTKGSEKKVGRSASIHVDSKPLQKKQEVDRKPPPPVMSNHNRNLKSMDVANKINEGAVIYNYPLDTTETNLPPVNNHDVVYPSAPALEDHHDITSYTPHSYTYSDDSSSSMDSNMAALNCQMKTMSLNTFTPITPTPTPPPQSPYAEDDYQMYLQFKEFLRIQNNGQITQPEDQLQKLFQDFKERYHKSTKQPLPPQHAVTPPPQSYVTTTKNPPTQSEKKRDNFKDVRKRYENQKLEEIRINQMKERNKAHFAQEFQAPAMDYNTLMMREKSLQNCGHTINNATYNNYPTLPSVSGDVVSNGTYIPFQASNQPPQPRRQEPPKMTFQQTQQTPTYNITANSNPNTTSQSGWSDYLTYNYWKQ